MKNIITVLVLAVTTSTSLYAQDNKKISKMMENEEKKEQVFTAIMQDPELKKEMMQHMMKDAKKDSTSCNMMGEMMMKDGHMQEMMMGKMMDGAAKDDGMCKKMCMMMMDNDKMMNMMDKMKDKKSMDSMNKNEKSVEKDHNMEMHQNNNQ
ncbi:hypothetical protein RM553_06760 [Zunongwangia sp. F363]|uniref:Uncharacterized protein n=1 Tax=Autumnicola tepida TaxID=3075595 RepID=A0ABU3C853_9FLAO|nr:hypothetical protein [Zunongwangia sp. F363]MDT0642531.1 hypothetical protein [Zunongwangia sp. F363]